MLKYRMYVDEVGNPDLKNSGNANHRFLSLTGVIVDLPHIQQNVHPEMEKLKQRYFVSHPDEPIILHRKELVNAAHPFQALRNPETKDAFNRDLLALLTAWHYRVITVCLDKKRHNETYTTWRYDPYHYCLEILLERFHFLLSRLNVKGDVIAESRGGKEDRRLKDSFHRLWEKGTGYVTPDQFQNTLTSRELKIKPKSANIAGLQLADLLAHPSRCEILQEQGQLSRPLASFAKEIIAILESKYDQSPERCFGKKFL